MEKKRGLLILSVLPFLLVYPGYDWMFHWAVAIPILTLSVWVWLYNFNFLVILFHQKPIYFEDLENTEFPAQRECFQKLFIHMLSICIAILVGVTLDFQMSSWKAINWFTIVGLVGGVWTVVDKLEGYFGNVLLRCINYARLNSPQVKSMASTVDLEPPEFML